jgi:hypothetical protein
MEIPTISFLGIGRTWFLQWLEPETLQWGTREFRMGLCLMGRLLTFWGFGASVLGVVWMGTWKRWSWSKLFRGTLI